MASTWRPSVYLALALGLAAIIALLAVEGFLAVQLRSRDFDLGSFLLALLGLVLLGLVAAQGFAIFSLLRTYYLLDASSLTIVCGPTRYVVALASISDVLSPGSDSLRIKSSPSPVPGHPARLGDIDGIGQVLLISTSRRLSRMVVIVTSDLAFAISPRDRDMFVEELNGRREGLPFRAWPVEVFRPWLARLEFWHDPVALGLLLAALIGNVVVFAYVSYKFPGLPPLLPLHYNSAGEIDFIGARWEAFKIPAIGTAAVLGDVVVSLFVHGRERIATHLLLSAAVAVQIILLVATVRIVY